METRIPFEYQWLNDGHLLASYVPRSPGPHSVALRWKGADIRGSPFTCKVAESADLLRQNSKYGQSLITPSYREIDDVSIKYTL